MLERPEYSGSDLETVGERAPSINERELSLIDQIGGQYQGYVEYSGERRYEEIWRDIKIIYDYSRKQMEKVSVETRAQSDSGRPREAKDITNYQTLVNRYTVSGDRIEATDVFDHTLRTIQIDRSGLRRLVGDLHQYIVRNLETLSKRALGPHIKLFVDEWLTENGYELDM